jgi:glycosyltransferase involved in cell wall biosynthesis
VYFSKSIAFRPNLSLTQRGVPLEIISSEAIKLQSLSSPKVSVVICTRNRGSRIVETIESILANDHSSFEIQVIDQSTNRETFDALQQFQKEPRLLYHHTATQGTGLSRNIGLQCANADMVLYTDDDCTVPPDWISKMARVLETYPQVSVVCCNVEPGEHDSTQGVIPVTHFKKDALVTSFIGHFLSSWMAAGMAVRKSSVIHWDGFDSTMGPGSTFQCGEDIDIVYRALFNHCAAYQLSQVAVTHNGFRTFEEYRKVIARDLVGLGAVHAKYLKILDLRILFHIFTSMFVVCLWQPVIGTIKSGKARGYKRIIFYLQGIISGVRTPMDRTKLVYIISR